MFSNYLNALATSLLLVCLMACTGCYDQSGAKTEKKKEAAAETGPTTFNEAAEKLVSMKNTIRDGFASGDVDSAHGPLHEVGHVLEKMSVLAREADLTDEQLKAVDQAKEALFDSFGNIDKTLHGGEGSTYDDEAEAIQAAMKVIVEAAGVKDDSPASPPPAAGDGLPPAEDGTVETGDTSGN